MPADEFEKWKNEWGKGRGLLQIEVLAMRAAWDAGIESIINAYPKLRAAQQPEPEDLCPMGGEHKWMPSTDGEGKLCEKCRTYRNCDAKEG